MAVFLKGILVLLIADFSLAVDESSIEAAFKEYQLVPEIIPWAPEAYASVEFKSGVEAQLGNELTPTDVKCMPYVKWVADNDAHYLVAMFDPDVPSRETPTQAQLKHWIVGNVPCSDISHGDTIADYISSAPPKGTGLHRYVFLIFKQPDVITFDETHLNNTSNYDRPYFSMTSFAKKYKLGNPIAGNFFQAQYDGYVDIVNEQLEGQTTSPSCTTSY